LGRFEPILHGRDVVKSGFQFRESGVPFLVGFGGSNYTLAGFELDANIGNRPIRKIDHQYVEAGPGRGRAR